MCSYSNLCKPLRNELAALVSAGVDIVQQLCWAAVTRSDREGGYLWFAFGLICSFRTLFPLKNLAVSLKEKY